MLLVMRCRHSTLGTVDPGPAPRALPLAAGAEQGPAARILAAARTLLFERGMDGLTTDRLARQAQVSKTSLYKHFPDLSSLLEAVIASEAERISHGLPQEPAHTSEFWEALKTYGANLLALLNRPDVIRLDQLMHEQAHRHPQLGARFFAATYGRSLRELESLLSYGVARGFIRQPVEPQRDAEMLLSLWEGFAFGRARLGITDQPFPDPAGWAAACVDRLFPADVW
jgi:TetR/AcrR family transcriptional regulator, mexJK operon transcriptional repressor